jgi:adenosylhomocysteine nucleosidase
MSKTVSGEATDKVDAVILTVLPEEYDAICSRLLSLDRWPGKEDHRNIYAWQIGIVTTSTQKGSYSIVIGMTGRAGTNDSTAATIEAIQLWNPSYIFFIGIAGGISSANKGDVIIANVIYGYEYGKISDKGFESWTDWTYQTDHGLFTGASAHAIDPDWHEFIKQMPPEACESKAFGGGIASGDKVVDNPDDDFFADVLKVFPRVVAVEMEGAGVANAIEKARAHGRNVGFMMIRGISDRPRPISVGEEIRGTLERDDWTPYAADVAAAFTIGYIAHGLPMPPKTTIESIYGDSGKQKPAFPREKEEFDKLIAPLYNKFKMNYNIINYMSMHKVSRIHADFSSSKEELEILEREILETMRLYGPHAPDVLGSKMWSYVNAPFYLYDPEMNKILKEISQLVEARYNELRSRI